MLLSKQRRKAFKLSDFITRPVSYPPKLTTLALQRITFQILFLLQRKSYQGIPERIDQLRKMLKYELKKEGYERAALFLQLLHQLERGNFQIKNLKNIEKYLQPMQSIPIAYGGKVAALEILPYEKLWELIIKQLV